QSLRSATLEVKLNFAAVVYLDRIGFERGAIVCQRLPAAQVKSESVKRAGQISAHQSTVGERTLAMWTVGLSGKHSCVFGAKDGHHPPAHCERLTLAERNPRQRTEVIRPASRKNQWLHQHQRPSAQERQWVGNARWPRSLTGRLLRARCDRL